MDRPVPGRGDSVFEAREAKPELLKLERWLVAHLIVPLEKKWGMVRARRGDGLEMRIGKRQAPIIGMEEMVDLC